MRAIAERLRTDPDVLVRQHGHRLLALPVDEGRGDPGLPVRLTGRSVGTVICEPTGIA